MTRSVSICTGLTRAFGGQQPEVLGAEFLLQGGEVGLHAPAGPVVDEHEAVAVVDAAAGRGRRTMRRLWLSDCSLRSLDWIN
jgi:hypothetical protein